MPTFIPDRLKTPGNFPSIDANDNQIRGFGFFANATARTALDENFRCEGYLAFMKDTDQFKQYNNTVVDDSTWGNDSNWVLLEGTSTDTYWAADADGTGIYYSNQVIVGATTYTGDDKFYVSGGATVTGSLKAGIKLETPLIHSTSGLDVVLNTDESDTAGDDFRVRYRVLESGGSERTAFDISPYRSTATIEFGNTSDDFKIDTYSPSFSEFRTISSNADETGFKFSDMASGTKSMLFRMKDDDSYLELKDGGRKITLSPHTYKISSSVEANANVLSGVEMLMPDSATGDWTFNHLANKDYVFNTNTSSDSKLITKFHAFGNGVVSIGTANHYNEYNGIQYTTVSNSLQPRLFIVNDGTSNVGVRVQSGNTSLGEEGARTQGRYFTDVRDDGFYISRVSTGPVYDGEAAEGEEWDGSGNPDAVIGMRRGPSNGNSLALFARNDLYFFSNGNESAFQINGDPSADTRTLKVWSPDTSSNIQIVSYNSSFTTVGAKFSIGEIGEFLIVKSNENRITSGSQILSSTIRGAMFKVTNLGDPTLNTSPPLEVYSLLGKTDNTGYWWGADGDPYNTEADLNAAGTTLVTNKSADKLAIYVPKHGSGRVGIGTTDPLAKLHVLNGSIAVGDVAGYDGSLAGGHEAGVAPGTLFLNGGGLITRGGTNIIDNNEIHTNCNSRAIEWKVGNTETVRQAVLTTNGSGGIRFQSDNRNMDYDFGKYGFSIKQADSSGGGAVDKPLYIKPRFPSATNDLGYTGGGNDGNGNVNQSLVYPLYFHYADAPSTLENLRIRTQINDDKGASYDYGLDYDATATQGDTGNPFTANKTRLRISATFPFAQSQTDEDGRHTSLSGVIGTSEASIEIRNAYETDVSGGTNANTAGTLNTALYVGGQRFYEPRSRNNTRIYGFSNILFTRALNYGTTGDLSPEDNDLVNDITTDVTGGTAGSYVLSTSNSGEITLSSSTYDTSVDGELSLKVTLNAADNVSAVEIIEGGYKITSDTGFRSGDTITIPATKLGSSSTQVVITLSSDAFVTDGGSIAMGLAVKRSISISAGNTSIRSNDTNTSYVDLSAGGSFHLARTAVYQTYRDHWFKFVEGTGPGHWSSIQGAFVKNAKFIVGYHNDQQKNHDGSATINTANYGTAALRVVSSPSGMRVGDVAIASNSSSVLKFAEADLDEAGFTDESSTWGVDYDADGGWYIGMPIYVSSTDSQHMIKQVRPDGVFQYNSGSDVSTFQRRIVLDINNSSRQMTLDSALTTPAGGDTLVYSRTESDLIRCRNIMGRDLFVVKSNGRLDLENGLIKMRASDYTPSQDDISSEECILYWDGTNLKIVKGGSGTTTIV